ncbi:hypothetical protein BAUCODRAFT_144693 [Baudoinia panamericana UAMH 10762]|uniref:Pal1 cell morphology protein n=1 Tax=Baudoinia panamericana (strain UAMH 10762) TaxID=717646 RepID=M2NQ38_BAUPA|nr:uncharacterized protein BAUCODRAFT_144693 [Baudoinia panamericana UAMH 10762]EMD01131.1 hypothetical protein BAUCODRAFT_144693 [Baudoinia panamericana UAMH 10762]
MPLASNNPFRNRATSPAPPSMSTTPADTAPPSVSQPSRTATNPFLDPSDIAMSPPRENGTSKGKSNGNPFAEDIFKDLSLLDKPASNGTRVVQNGAPARAGTLPTPGHRPSGSEERRDRPLRPFKAPDSPVKKQHDLRPRGMSESSVMDDKELRKRLERERGERSERTESEERRRRERRREREERHKKEKEKIRKGERPAKRPQGLDIIDKLDVTGIYGQGLFHHDGPFDACNPHRNARKDRRAPMQAFPEGSMNMMLGGSGPVRSRLDLDKYYGRGEEGFQDYAVTRKTDTAIINPTDRTEQVHGIETTGLGTSTFLEGAPASKAALQQREYDDPIMPEAAPQPQGGALTRKRSLAQRIRGMSSSRRGGPNGLRSPDARYNDNDPFDYSPPQPGSKAVSAGGPMRARYTKENEINPFDTAYDDAFDKKGAQIKVAEQEASAVVTTPGGRARAPSSPKVGYGLVRSVTTDSAAAGVRKGSDEEERSSGGGGFLSRMRSLKGGRRARPERRDT